MNVIYNDMARDPFAPTAAAMPGRIDAVLSGLERYPRIQPSLKWLGLAEDLAYQVHDPRYIGGLPANLYRYAIASAASALYAADLALHREMAFAITNPPGHHAGRSKSWGFCYMNNMALAVAYLQRYLPRIIVVDLDMHTGDGSEALLRAPRAIYYHAAHGTRTSLIKELRFFLREQNGFALGISAGFDNGRFDWGNLLSYEDYYLIGRDLGWFARSKCRGRLFLVLEGGYNQHVLGRHVRSLIDGIERG